MAKEGVRGEGSFSIYMLKGDGKGRGEV